MFLKEIAQHIIKTHGNNLANIAVIFPNKRASLWMNDYLLEAAAAPVFAPKYCSIQELFQRHSRLALADHIQLVSILHKTYCKITGGNETLDQFYAWGEILLADFDNVDKSLADPQQIFRNISSLHEMDGIDYLSESQKELLERFFQSFTHNHESKIQQKFISLWNNLTDIYLSFKETLAANGIAYEGMLYRDVAENIKHEDFLFTHYYAIGFNQLLKCEQKLFLKLADKLTVKNDEASINTVNKEAKITIAQSLTDDLQARYIETWLTENGRLEAGRKTAVILCDERLLPSAIYHLPDNRQNTESSSQISYNITAGFPLADTQPASYIATLLELCTEGLTKDRQRFRLSYLRNLEGHPLHTLALQASFSEVQPRLLAAADSTAQLLSILSDTIATTATKLKGASELLQEAAFRIYNTVTRLKTLHEQGFLDIDPLTLARLYKQIVITATIPFHGEPAKGIQIMGVLETRNLDFDHILILSCNEGIMPQGSSDTSVIPYAIKKAFELSTTDDRTDIYAYYFYRLLKRCKDITLVYNASGSDTSPGEMSRFLLNLIVNNSQQIERTALQTTFLSHTRLPKPQPKTSEDLHNYISQLTTNNSKSTTPTPLSPTAINTYMRCEKSFYYKYFRKLREEADDEESMDAAAFGSFFHNAAEDFYRKFINQGASTIYKHHLQPYIDKPALLELHINRALEKTKQELYGTANIIESGGMEQLLKSIVRRYMQRLLINDLKFTPFTVLSLEETYYKEYTINTPEGELTVKIGGAVDRLDLITNGDGAQTIRVVDYKTGADHSDVKIENVDDIFNNAKEGSAYYRQTILYCLAVEHELQKTAGQNNAICHSPIVPALYYIRNKAIGSDEKYNPVLRLSDAPISSINDLCDDYENLLFTVLDNIFNKPVFDIPADLSVCNNCPFAELCKESPSQTNIIHK